MDYEIKVISLERRPDRREHTIKTFKDKFEFEFVDAIDAKTYDFGKGELGLFHTECHNWQMSCHASYAIALTNMKIWRYCYENNINIVILEDDLELIDGFDVDFDTLFRLKFDILFLHDVAIYGPNCDAYCIKPDGARKVYDHFIKHGFNAGIEFELVGLPKDVFTLLDTEGRLFPKSVIPNIRKSDIAHHDYKYLPKSKLI